MASIAHRLPENVGDDFYVDSSCIDCDACRQIAPGIFRDHGDQSSVYHQPESEEETRRALMSLVACPTGSIGMARKHDARIGIEAFPISSARTFISAATLPKRALAHGAISSCAPTAKAGIYS